MALLTGYSVDSTSLKDLTAGISFGLRRTGALGETMNRRLAGSAITITTANAVYSAIYLTAGTVVTNITFVSGSTAAGTPTHQLFGLYDSGLNKLASTADATSAAWAANSEKTLALTSPYTVTADGIYYLACAVVATTPPTLCGQPQATVALNALAPAVAVTDSSNTISTSLPATATASAGFPAVYGYVS